MTRTSIRALREQVFQFHTKLCNWPPEWHVAIIYPSSLFKKVEKKEREEKNPTVLTILICSDELQMGIIFAARRRGVGVGGCAFKEIVFFFALTACCFFFVELRLQGAV